MWGVPLLFSEADMWARKWMGCNALAKLPYGLKAGPAEAARNTRFCFLTFLSPPPPSISVPPNQSLGFAPFPFYASQNPNASPRQRFVRIRLFSQSTLPRGGMVDLRGRAAPVAV